MNQPLPNQQAPQMKPENPRKKIIRTVVIVFIVLLAMGATAWYFFLGPGKSKLTILTNKMANPTAKWYKFESKTFGFSIKYPVDWEYKSEDTVTSFRPKTLKEDYLLIIDVKNDSLQSIIDAQKNLFSKNSTFQKQETVNLGDEQATKLTFTNNADKIIQPVVYLMEKNNRVYVISGEGAAGDYNETVKLMANSFKFETSTTQTGGEEVAFEVLAAGSISTDTKLEAKNYSIKNNQEFKDLWDEIYSLGGQEKALPSVDFNIDMVIAVVANQASTGGFEMEITKIVESQTALEVTIKETSVAGGCPATSVMNQPFEFIKIQKTNKEIKFTPEKETKNC